MEINSDAPISHEELVDNIMGMVDDNLVVSEKAESTKESPKTEVKEVTEEESDDDYLADVDSEDEVEGDDKPESEDVAEEDSKDDDVDTQDHIIKVDGEDTTVTLDELKKGYSRHSDYTKKTQELAEQRKVIEEESKTLSYLTVQKELQPEVLRLEGLQSSIAIAEEAIDTGVEILPDGKSRTLTDEAIKATEANVAKAKRDLKRGQKSLNEKLEGYSPPKLDVLKEKVPGLFSEDAKVRDEVLKAHGEVLSDIGYTGVEINAVNDPRLILLVQEVKEGRQLKKSVEAAKARRTGKKHVVSKNTKSVRKDGPRNPSSSNDQPKDINKMAENFRKGENFSMEDFLGDVM